MIGVVTSPADGQSKEPQFPVQPHFLLVPPQFNQQATTQIRTAEVRDLVVKGTISGIQEDRGGLHQPNVFQSWRPAIHLKGLLGRCLSFQDGVHSNTKGPVKQEDWLLKPYLKGTHLSVPLHPDH